MTWPYYLTISQSEPSHTLGRPSLTWPLSLLCWGDFLGGPVVRTSPSNTGNVGMRVWSLVGELRNHTPLSQKTKAKTQHRSKIVTNSIKTLKNYLFEKWRLKNHFAEIHQGVWARWALAVVRTQQQMLHFPSLQTGVSKLLLLRVGEQTQVWFSNRVRRGQSWTCIRRRHMRSGCTSFSCGGLGKGPHSLSPSG